MRKNKTIIEILFLKEIRDILRDKKTLVIMVIVPLLLYPAMIIGLTLILSQMGKSQMENTYYVIYEEKDEMVIRDLRDSYEKIKEEENLSLNFLKGGDFFSDTGKVELQIQEENQKMEITLHYNSTNQDSSTAHTQFKKVIEHYEEKILEKRLLEKGLEKEFLTPVTIQSMNEATESEAMGISIGGSLGMLLITTIMISAFYPTIDVITGEKERGTLETLLTLPVNNFQMILSKFIAVSFFSCISAVLSILSIGGSVGFLISSVDKVSGEDSLGIDFSFFLSSIPVLLVVVMITALLLTAISMCFCIFAKSFKEANNYFTPIMLIIMFASMASMLPTVELELKTALIPIVNVSLLIKAVAMRKLSYSLAMVTIIVNLSYSILTVWILAKIYRSENVLFKDGFQSFSLFEKRSDIKPGTIPKTGDLILTTVILLLLILYLGIGFGARSQLAGAIVNQLLILIIPVLLIWYMKLDMKKIFSCRKPEGKSVLGGGLIYPGTFCLTMILSFFLMKLMPQSTGNLEAGFEEILQYPMIILVVVIALMPAVGEELFFRGLLFGSWRFRMGPIMAMLLSSLIFGAFHMSFVKLLPTAMLGLCFAYITWKTKSIYPGMALHFLNNSFSLLTMKYGEEIGEMVPILTKTELEIKDILGLSVAGILFLGFGMLLMEEKKLTKREDRK